MKLITCALLALVVAFAADPPKPKPEVDLAAKLAATEQQLRLAQLENIARQKQSIVDGANSAIAKLDAQAQALADSACKYAGIDPDPKICAIDVLAKTVTKRPPEAPVAAKK